MGARTRPAPSAGAAKQLKRTLHDPFPTPLLTRSQAAKRLKDKI